jgi:hypothetical protein
LPTPLVVVPVADDDVVVPLVVPLELPPVETVLGWCLLDALTTLPRFFASTRPCAFIARKTFPHPWPPCFICAI